MAVIKQRVHRMNSSGSYDTIYYETSSDLVICSDGNSVESHIESLKNTIDSKADFDTVAILLQGGVLIYSNTVAGSYTYTVSAHPISAKFYQNSYKIGVVLLGGGGAGAASCRNDTSYPYNASGGASGYLNVIELTVTAGTQYDIVVGAGGKGNTTTTSTVNGSSGGATSFDTYSANGGSGGSYGRNKTSGGYNPTVPGGVSASGNYGSNIGAYGNEASVYNPYTKQYMLASGGGASPNNSGGNPGGINPYTNTQAGGNGSSGNTNATVIGGNAIEVGCGGGGAAAFTGSCTGGNGADGGVFIYYV